MTNTNDDSNVDGLQAVGILTSGDYEPDDLPIAQPDGVVSFLGSAWHGEHECYPIVDMKVALDGDTIKALLTIDQARDMARALGRAIRMAEATASDALS